MNLFKTTPLVTVAMISMFAIGNAVTQILKNSVSFVFAPQEIIPTLIWIGASATAFSVTAGITSILIKDTKVKLTTSALFLLSYFAGTFTNSNTLYSPLLIIINAALMLTGLFIMDKRIYEHYTNLIKPKLGNAVQMGAKGFMSILSITIAVTFYLSNHSAKHENAMKNKLIGQIIKPTSFIIEQQIGKQAESLNIKSKEQMDNLINQLNVQFGDFLKSKDEEVLGITDTMGITPTINISDQIEPLLKKQIEQLIAPYTKYITPALTVLLYLTINFFFSVVSIFISPLATIATRILEGLEYIRKEKQTVEVTRLTL